MTRHYHLMGIGGTGMSTLAELLKAEGETVSGCDARRSETTERLRATGIAVAEGHDPAHLSGVDVLVVSSAIPGRHPERLEAERRGIAVQHRAEALAGLVNARHLVAVAGAHGKTTLTGLLVHVLASAGLDPLGAIGFAMPGSPSGARWGRGEWAVVEADESDRSFLHFEPTIGVVTNVEPDHLENYHGRFQDLIAAYRAFLDRVRPEGTWVLGTDNAILRETAATAPEARRLVTFALHARADWQASDIHLEARTARFVALYRGKPVAEVQLSIPGRHNVCNALAALAVARLAGIDAPRAASSMAGFSGARRRFEVLADTAGVMVVDDYAHHPTEIAATLAAAKEGYGRRVVAVFQPHRYHRTASLMDDLAAAFDGADTVILTEIYAPTPEEVIPGVGGRALFDRLLDRPAWRDRTEHAFFCPTLDEAYRCALSQAEPGTLILVMGAGNVTSLAHRLAERVKARAN
ncbi:UDP-N-acetylmuramate--L-alanine ligase [Carboxydochorda subterranea]|uniref:UDP-N-acetylmuramate--L-alanine ligase n=1 Tax=Carboxydichorda subterranea TaxID=3109565 RepID=A0ABZ1C1D5_9FIRM|nr:UDP-N-acetylmuramate--L-alanine ligase [Limnochorda sp. L945t]WRP18601.1 UDP-N-acetylmuramate--L-alanine ligase [Limnochorda sp. L945t]